MRAKISFIAVSSFSLLRFIHVLARLIDTRKFTDAPTVGHLHRPPGGARVTVNRPKQRKRCLEKLRRGLAA
jgi:hypothetical protein